MNHSAETQKAPLARRDDLVVQEMPDEVLVYDMKQHKAHCLNHTAAFVWAHCDGQTSAAEMAALMQQEFSKPVSEDVIWLALKQLSKSDLLQERLVTPEGSVNLARRSALRRLGQATALALPLVTSIVAPTAAALASIPVQCRDCVKKVSGVGSCPSVCDSTVLGSCFDNSGCGNGQLLIANVPCVPCLSGAYSPPPFNGTVSWRAPN